MRSRPRATKTSSATGLAFDGPYESVWDAIEDDLAERQRKKLLSGLMIELKQYVESQGWTQKEAAMHFGVTQPRVSDLMRGKINLFSIDAVVGMTGMAGLRLEFALKLQTPRRSRS